MSDVNDVREFFREEQAGRVKVDKGRITLPNKEGFKDCRLILLKGKRPFVVRHQHFLGGGVLTSPNTPDARGYLQGPDPIAKAGQSAWAKYRSAKQSGDKERMDAAYKHASNLTPKFRSLWLAVDCESPDEGVKVLTMSEKLHHLVVDQIAGNPKLGEVGFGDVFNLDTGRTLRVVKHKGPAQFFVFDKSKFLDASKFGSAEQRKVWAATHPDLEATDLPASPEQLQAALDEYMGGGSDGQGQGARLPSPPDPNPEGFDLANWQTAMDAIEVS